MLVIAQDPIVNRCESEIVDDSLISLQKSFNVVFESNDNSQEYELPRDEETPSNGDSKISAEISLNESCAICRSAFQSSDRKSLKNKIVDNKKRDETSYEDVIEKIIGPLENTGSICA